MTRWTCWAFMASGGRWAPWRCRWSRAWARAERRSITPPPHSSSSKPRAVGAALLWSAIASYAIAKFAALVVGLRVDREHETSGLDFASHGETGYHINR